MPYEEDGYIETINRPHILANEEAKHLNIKLRSTKEKN